MENRVGLNLLYAQVSLELPQNPSPENGSGVPLPRKLSYLYCQFMGKFLEYSQGIWHNLYSPCFVS